MEGELGIRLGIMGALLILFTTGTWATAEAARTAFNLDQVLFVPNRLPPHKKIIRYQKLKTVI